MAIDVHPLQGNDGRFPDAREASPDDFLTFYARNRHIRPAANVSAVIMLSDDERSVESRAFWASRHMSGEGTDPRQLAQKAQRKRTPNGSFASNRGVLDDETTTSTDVVASHTTWNDSRRISYIYTTL